MAAGGREGVNRDPARAATGLPAVPPQAPGAGARGRGGSARRAWVQSSGRGTGYSDPTVDRPEQPAVEVPYAVAIVGMEEGWHTLTNIVGCEPEDVVVGLAVEVQFHAISDEITLPLFSPV